MKIIDAIMSLDTKNDDHWTNAGAPSMAALKEMVGDDTITRDMVAAAMPEGFERGTMSKFPLEEEGEDNGRHAGSMEAEERVETAMADVENPDAIALIEAFCAAVQTDRFRRNYEMQAIVQDWTVRQRAAIPLQARIDKREEDRRKRELAAAAE